MPSKNVHHECYTKHGCYNEFRHDALMIEWFTFSVGKKISTKNPKVDNKYLGDPSRCRMDITNEYKSPEGNVIHGLVFNPYCLYLLFFSFCNEKFQSTGASLFHNKI